MKNIRYSKGFTLLELIIVIAVLGILAAVLVPTIGNYVGKANMSVAQSNGASVLQSCKLISADIANEGGITELTPATILSNSNLIVQSGLAAVDNAIVVNIVDNEISTLWSMKGGKLAMWTTDRGWILGEESIDYIEEEVLELSFGLAHGNTAYVVKDGRSFSKANLVIPSTYEGLPVIGIANNAFNGCTTLVSVSLPSNLESIGASTFNGCSSLINITIPASVTSIGNNAFSGCTKLGTVTILRTSSKEITEGGKNMFQNCSSLVAIYVPSKLVNIYKEADGWEKYKKIILAS